MYLISYRFIIVRDLQAFLSCIAPYSVHIRIVMLRDGYSALILIPDYIVRYLSIVHMTNTYSVRHCRELCPTLSRRFRASNTKSVSKHTGDSSLIIMSSRFVSGGAIDGASGEAVVLAKSTEPRGHNSSINTRHLAEWETVERELQEERRKRAEAKQAAGSSNGEKSLYEVLEANKGGCDGTQPMHILDRHGY